MLVAATELLATNPAPTEAEVREALSGNLCRCTGYDSIVAGVLLAASRIAGAA
jgi:aerobic-type carbon monoxide dehydrogenase small subunit (CoxS/CutS family)